MYASLSSFGKVVWWGAGLALKGITLLFKWLYESRTYLNKCFDIAEKGCISRFIFKCWIMLLFKNLFHKVSHIFIWCFVQLIFFSVKRALCSLQFVMCRVQCAGGCISGLQASRILGRAHKDSTPHIYNWILPYVFFYLHPNGIEKKFCIQAVQDNILLNIHCTVLGVSCLLYKRRPRPLHRKL